jgi:DNA ligase-1
MLAHTYKDPKSGKLKNPVKGFPAAPKGWYASEKFDGYRAIWDGKDFRSRTGKIFEAPKWFKDWLPPSVALDGELFMGRECFEKCGLFRRKVPDDKEWREANVTYQIFDMPAMDAPFEERVAAVERLVTRQCALQMPKTHGECPLRVTEQKVVQTEEEVFKMFDTLVEKGAEGVMLRCPGSPYDSKRSAHLLKVKPFFDAECKIIGYKSGTGKYSGKLGAFHCEAVKDPKAKFYISGMTDEVRNNYEKSHPVGTIVTYTYVGVNESGVPRHPNYLRKRESE